jgi:hypothetical protein
MAKQVCIDALVYFNAAVLAERSDATISWDTDIAEARPFKSSPANAFADKSPTWKSWSASLEGFYDDADNALVTAAINNTQGMLIVYPTRADMNKYWYGNAYIVNVEHGINSEDFSSLNAEAEGTGTLTWATDV